jgi:hypothetical protein
MFSKVFFKDEMVKGIVFKKKGCSRWWLILNMKYPNRNWANKRCEGFGKILKMSKRVFNRVYRASTRC